LVRALSDKANKTKFKLLFSNVTEADILLREDFDALQKKYPDTFDVVYVLGQPDGKWQGEPSVSSK
jgi:cytochrome-b5 reductase